MKKCPVCEFELEEPMPAFCPQEGCGWDLKDDRIVHVDLPDHVVEEYKQRLQIARRNWNERLQLMAQRSELEAEFGNFRKQKEETEGQTSEERSVREGGDILAIAGGDRSQKYFRETSLLKSASELEDGLPFQNGYRVLYEANMRQVLEHFLSMESTKPGYASSREEMSSWFRLSDSDFIERMRLFGSRRDDVPPALTWTVGTPGNTHHLTVSRWIFAEVELASLYSCGISPLMSRDLEVAHGNLKRFTALARAYPEFEFGRVPSDDTYKTIIGIVRTESEKDGFIELIDGVHRAIPMIQNGLKKTLAYLGELKPV